jgi:hypothetical protein
VSRTQAHVCKSSCKAKDQDKDKASKRKKGSPRQRAPYFTRLVGKSSRNSKAQVCIRTATLEASVLFSPKFLTWYQSLGREKSSSVADF